MLSVRESIHTRVYVKPSSCISIRFLVLHSLFREFITKKLYTREFTKTPLFLSTLSILLYPPSFLGFPSLLLLAGSASLATSQDPKVLTRRKFLGVCVCVCVLLSTLCATFAPCLALPRFSSIEFFAASRCTTTL